MNAIAQPKTSEIVGRINALQGAAVRYIDTASVNPFVREWHAIGREIDALMRVDACSAWELTGAWKGLTGDWEAAEAAFENSVRIGNSTTNRVNWMLNQLNFGRFGAAQETYRRFGSPELGQFTTMLSEGFEAGAVEQASLFIEKAMNMHLDWNHEQARDIRQANDILREAGISDEMIAEHLDIAGVVLRRHSLRPVSAPRVTSEEGVFRGVTYVLLVPVSVEMAFEMNVELAREEDLSAIRKDVAFDVVFEAARS